MSNASDTLADRLLRAVTVCTEVERAMADAVTDAVTATAATMLAIIADTPKSLFCLNNERLPFFVLSGLLPPPGLLAIFLPFSHLAHLNRNLYCSLRSYYHPLSLSLPHSY